MELEFVQVLKCPYCKHPFDRNKYKPLVVCHSKHVLCQLCVIKSGSNANCLMCSNQPILYDKIKISMDLYKQLPKSRDETFPPEIDPHVFANNNRGEREKDNSKDRYLQELKARKEEKREEDRRKRNTDIQAQLSAQSAQSVRSEQALDLRFKEKAPQMKKEECKCPCNCNRSMWIYINYILFLMTQIAIVEVGYYLSFDSSTEQCTADLVVFASLSLRTWLITNSSLELFYLLLLPIAILLYKRRCGEAVGCCVPVIKMLFFIYLLLFVFNIVVFILALAGGMGSCPAGVLAFCIVAPILYMVRPIFMGVILRGIKWIII